MAERDTATGSEKRRKTRAKAQWSADAERKLIEVWADVLVRFGGTMIKKKAKAQKAADRLNEYVRRELLGVDYSADEVLAKIDNITAKARKYYTIYQRPRETGRSADEDDIFIDLEAAVMAWPNFETFYHVFRHHPTFGPGASDDSCDAEGVTTVVGASDRPETSAFSPKDSSQAAAEPPH